MSMDGRVYYVGSEREVAHHVRPLQGLIDVVVIGPEEVVQIAQPGDVAVFYSEHFDRFRSACVALRQRNIATLYAIDGILEWRNAWENRVDEIACPWTMRPCLSHVVATIGPRQTAILRSWGNSACVPIGLPRLDSLTTCFLAAHDKPLSPGERSPSLVDVADSSQLTGEDSRGMKFRILVMTAKCPGFTEAQIETTVRSLVSLRENVEQQPTIDGREIELVWRLTGGLDERLGVTANGLERNSVPEAAGLPDLLKQVDAVITTPSTAQLEAMLLDRPVASLDFHNTPSYAETAYRISAPEHVRPVLEQLAAFSHSPAHQSLQRFLLRESLWVDGQATERLVRLLRWMQTQSKLAQAAGRSWELDVADLVSQLPYPSDRPQEIFWALREARIGSGSDAQPEGSRNPVSPMSLAQWQAYTEQMERENHRLSRLVSEAHQVFASLHGHPVWGALLKSHEWWSRWWQGDAGKLAKPESWKEP